MTQTIKLGIFIISVMILFYGILAECEDHSSNSGQQEKDDGQKEKDGGQKVKDGGQKAKDGGQKIKDGDQKKEDGTLVVVLSRAVMCESIKGFEPAEPAIVFSLSLGKIFCFTSFQNISQNAFIYHKWFHRDRFVATNRFLVKSPQWSTSSTMQLKVADKGPWRVEITDENDNLLKILRFSISD